MTTHPELEARIETLRRSSDEMIVAMGQRIAALEAIMKRDTDAIAQAVADLDGDAKAQPECFAKPAAPDRVCSECGGTPVICQQRRCYGFMNGHTKPGQPAAPDADEAAVEALKNIEVERGNGDDDGTHMEPLDLADWQINGIIAAIRDGKVPGVFPSEAAEANVQLMQVMKDAEIAALRAKLAEAIEDARVADVNWKERDSAVGYYLREAQSLRAESSNHAADAESARRDRDRLAAQVESLTRENQRLIEVRATPANDLIQQRDKALADIAAEREKVKRYDAHLAPKHDDKCEALADIRDGFDRIRDCTCFVPRAEVERLKADLAAATERAEKAIFYADHNALVIDALRGSPSDGEKTRDELAAIYGEKLKELQQRHISTIDAARAEADALRSEVEILRRYGNKDCTAMADAALAKRGGK